MQPRLSWLAIPAFLWLTAAMPAAQAAEIEFDSYNTRLYSQKCLGDFCAGARDTFVLLTVVMRNPCDAEPQEISAGYFQLLSEDGTFAADLGATPHSAAPLVSRTVAPCEYVRGTVVYMVPVGTEKRLSGVTFGNGQSTATFSGTPEWTFRTGEVRVESQLSIPRVHPACQPKLVLGQTCESPFRDRRVLTFEVTDAVNSIHALACFEDAQTWYDLYLNDASNKYLAGAPTENYAIQREAITYTNASAGLYKLVVDPTLNSEPWLVQILVQLGDGEVPACEALQPTFPQGEPIPVSLKTSWERPLNRTRSQWAIHDADRKLVKNETIDGAHISVPCQDEVHTQLGPVLNFSGGEQGCAFHPFEMRITIDSWGRFEVSASAKSGVQGQENTLATRAFTRIWILCTQSDTRLGPAYSAEIWIDYCDPLRREARYALTTGAENRTVAEGNLAMWTNTIAKPHTQDSIRMWVFYPDGNAGQILVQSGIHQGTSQVSGAPPGTRAPLRSNEAFPVAELLVLALGLGAVVLLVLRSRR